MTNGIVDVLVIGGGINGTGIAADAAGRGLSVLLCEQSDLASATSSKSSKLIHGGLRYLEHFEFRLVKEALAEREVLLNIAPHIAKPLKFVLPYQPHLRPTWMIRLGLFLYDNLADRRAIPDSRGIKFDQDSPLKPQFTQGFEYYDGWVDDARLVVSNALSAAEYGAQICCRTECIKVTREQNYWQVELKNCLSQQVYSVKCKVLVNAAGPWVASVFDRFVALKSPKKIRLVQGSHIIVPKIYQHQHAHILQNKDNRIVFVIPYEDDFSLIGTTDVDFNGEPSTAAISVQEMDYLIDIVNQYFNQQISITDVVSSYSGVRSLLEEEGESAQTVTRDYVLTLDDSGPPILSVFGGKITTYRKLAEAAVNKLSPFFSDMTAPWTAKSPLPGGNFQNFELFKRNVFKKYPWIEQQQLSRYCRCYGTRLYDLLADCQQVSDLGIDFGGGLFQQEVDFLRQFEWAISAEDILWRRTKLGLRLTQAQVGALTMYLNNVDPKHNDSVTEVNRG